MVEGSTQFPVGKGRKPKHKNYEGYVPDLLLGWSPHLDNETESALSEGDAALRRIQQYSEMSLASVLAEWMSARAESIYSSIIEGIESTEEDLVWAEYMDQNEMPVTAQNEALTLGAVRQVQASLEIAEKMRNGFKCRTDDIRRLHHALFANTRRESIGGVIRSKPIWIGNRANADIWSASFVAPPPREMYDLINDLLTYINSGHHAPCLHAALAHAQFETIHPFKDGNGRTGRALIHTILNARRAANTVIPISLFLETNRREYYEVLNQTRVICASGDLEARSQAITPWLEMFVCACLNAETQVESAYQKSQAIVEQWHSLAQPRKGSAKAVLLAALPSMPVFDIDSACVRLGLEKHVVRSSVRSLEQLGIIKSTGGDRNKRFMVKDIVEALKCVHPDGGHPDALLADDQHLTDLLSAPQTTELFVRCNHKGLRSRKMCVLGKGHSGQHRYI